MYAQHFGFHKEPFSIAPDPHFLFMSERHREALAHLIYGIDGGGGFVVLTGEIGTGKTTVCRCFLEHVPAHCAVAYIFNPRLTAVELLQSICVEFGIPPPADSSSVKAHVDALNVFLLGSHGAGRQAVLVIDEAQSLSIDVLEQLRLLTNLETVERKLLQIILIGQPELREMLDSRPMEQLAQRVIARYHLGPLSRGETFAYVDHRLAVAGGSARRPFTASALAMLHRLTAGVPRRINLLADRSLLGAFARGLATVDAAIVEQAAREVFGPRLRRRRSSSRQSGRWLGWLAAASLAGVAGLTIGWAVAQFSLRSHPSAAGAATAAPASGDGAFVAATKPTAVGSGEASADSFLALAATATAASATSGAASGAGPGAPAVPAADNAPPWADGAASSPPAAPPGDEASQLLAAAPARMAIAWRELALRWQVAIGEGDACTAAAQARLACYRSIAGGLPIVRQLQRPGLIALHAPGSEGSASGFAVLVSLGQRQATLVAAGRRFVLDLPTLASVWRGDFATFWRMPPGWDEGVDGVGGQRTAEWLDSRLAAAGVRTPGPLRSRVRDFQVAQGLPADGVPGPVTLMQLNRAVGVVEPSLEPGR